MTKRLLIELPNGKVCYLTSASMRAMAKLMRYETFTRGQYRLPGFELRADDTVIDIGSNIGMFALWTEPQIPRGRLICIEPNPRALECLEINVRQNGLRNVVIVPVAAGSQIGTTTLVCHPGWEALAHSAVVEVPWFFTESWIGNFARWLLQPSWRKSFQAEAAKPIVVQQMPLSHIMDEHGVAKVNFLKIDCEGSEYEVLRSLDAAHWARIERVVIEYHDFGRGRHHRELKDILRKNGFEAKTVRTILQNLLTLLGVRIGMIWAKKDLLSSAIPAQMTPQP